MPLETGTYISDLNASNPVGASDPKSQGDDHLRLIKSTLLATFPNITGEMSLTQAQLNLAAIKDESNTFTSDAQTIAALIPRWRLSETDQAVDEKNWDVIASAGQFGLRTRTDAFGGGEVFFAADRTGTVVDQVDIRSVLTRITAGGELRVMNATNADYLGISHDGTDVNAVTVGTTDVNLSGPTSLHLDECKLKMSGVTDANTLTLTCTDSLSSLVSTTTHLDVTLAAGGGDMRLKGGTGLSVFDATGADSITIKHNGLDVDVSFAGTTDINIQNGAKLKLFDSTNNDFVGITADGTDAIFDFLGCADVEFGQNSAPTGNYRFHSTDVDIIMYLAPTAGDAGWLRCTATTMEMRSLIHGAPVQILGEDAGGTAQNLMQGDPDGATHLYYAGTAQISTQDRAANGTTSGLSVDDHTGVARDVGFNVLPIQSEDVSDTLEAKHCGGVYFKDGAGAITLTLEANTGSDFPVGGVCTIINANAAGDITVTEGVGTTLYVLDGSTRTDSAGGGTVGPGGVATLWREASTVYYLFGSGVSP